MKSPKLDISPADFLDYPVWRFDPDIDGYEPLCDLDEHIESIEELHFRATVTSAIGHEFEGSVTGKGDIAIGIFANNRWYALNTEWRDASMDQLSALVEDCGYIDVSPSRLLPFKFRTTIQREPFIDWVGTIDLDCNRDGSGYRTE